MSDRRHAIDRAPAVASRLAAALIIAGTPAPAAGQAEGGPPATPVKVDRVEVRTLQERRKVTGELRAVQRSMVATIEPGLVTDMPVEEGQRVGAGEILAVLDARRLQIEHRRLLAQVKVAEAMMTARLADLEMRQRDLASLEDLERRSASNPKELADARSRVKVAEAMHEEAVRDREVTAARADLLRTRLDDTTITAPFAGVVVATLTEQGQWVAEGDAIAEIVTVGAVDAWLDVPQQFAEAVGEPGVAVEVSVDATGRTFGPLAARTVPRVDSVARTFNLLVRIGGEEDRLTPGMSVTGWVPTGRRAERLTIPRDALLRSPAGFFVYVARRQPQGAIAAVPETVHVLFRAGDRVAVERRGLEEGDLVVVEGNERLFPMMPVSYASPDASRSGTAAPAGPAAGEGS